MPGPGVRWLGLTLLPGRREAVFQVARSDAASGPARGRLITKKSNKRSGIETNKEMTLLAGTRARGLRAVGLGLGLN